MWGITNIGNIKRNLPVMSSSYIIASSLTFYQYELNTSLRYEFGLEDYVVSNIPLLKRDMANLIIDRVNHIFKMRFSYYSRDIEFYRFYNVLVENDQGLNMSIEVGRELKVKGEWFQNI